MIKSKKMLISLLVVAMLVASFAGTALADERSFNDKDFYNYELVEGIYKVNDTHFVIFPEDVYCSGISTPFFGYCCVKSTSRYGSAGYTLSAATGYQNDWTVPEQAQGYGTGIVLISGSGGYTGWVRAKLYDTIGYTNQICVDGRWKSGSSSSVAQGENTIYY